MAPPAITYPRLDTEYEGYPEVGSQYGGHPPPAITFATILAPSSANEGDDPAISATSADPLLSLTLQDVSPVVDVSIQTGVASPYATTYPDITPGTRQVRFVNEANPAEFTSTATIAVTPQAPTISAPLTGSSFNVGDLVTFTADGTADGWDANTTKVDILLDGVAVMSIVAPTAGVWTGDWNSAGYPPATGVVAVARRYWVGLAGEMGTVDSASISIDVTSGVTAADPLTIVSTVTPFFFLSADLGVSMGTGVATWADQSGSGNNAVQISGAAQPALISSDPDFGGRNSVSGDGSNDTMTMTWNPPAPGTTNIWFFAVLMQRTYTAGEYLMAGGNTILGLAQSAVTPQLRQFNTTGANANAGAVLNVPTRLEALFSSSVADYIKLAATTTTGVSAGNSDAPSFNLFSRNGAGFGDSKIACVGAWNGKPSAGELAALSTWVTNYYGGGIAV